MMFLIIVVFALICQQGSSDQSYYSDTGAIQLNQDFMVSSNPTVVFNIRTSNAYLAGTTNAITATLVGEFSSSGAHSIGSFGVGSNVQRSVTLNRNIGKIKSLILTNSFTDGWLPVYIQCVHDNEMYEFGVLKQWISTQSTEAQIEPNTHLIDEIKVFPVMVLNVTAVAPIYPANP